MDPVSLIAGLVIGTAFGLLFAAGRRRAAERDRLMRVPRSARSAAFEPSDAPLPAGDIDEDIRALAASGNKIEAIKQLRNRTGMGLREAKEAVERLG